MFFPFPPRLLTEAGPSISALTLKNAEIAVVKLMVHPNDTAVCLERGEVQV